MLNPPVLTAFEFIADRDTPQANGIVVSQEGSSKSVLIPGDRSVTVAHESCHRGFNALTIDRFPMRGASRRQPTPRTLSGGFVGG